MNALVAGLENPEFTEAVENQLCDTGYLGWPVFDEVKPGKPVRVKLS